MGQKCCSLLTGRPAPDDAPLRPHLLAQAQAWDQAPPHAQSLQPIPPQYLHGVGEDLPLSHKTVEPVLPALPGDQVGLASAPPLPIPQIADITVREAQKCLPTQPPAHVASDLSHRTVHCSTSGCNRRPWNGVHGETCCRTCVNTAGARHGPNCDQAASRHGGGDLSHKTVHCLTHGCTRRPWNRALGEACCKTCIETAGSDHGKACNQRSQGRVEPVSACIINGVDAGQLPCDASGAFQWILKSNEKNHRQMRLAAAQQTQQACSAQGFTLGDVQVPLVCLKQMCTHTRLVFSGDTAGLNPPGSTTRFFTHAAGQAATVALQCTRSGHMTSLVNASSSYHVGGGFLTGGRHALEESLCMQSTLFQSLEIASGHKHDCYENPYIPETAAVLSPDVEFFRSGSLDGYRFQPQVEIIAAVVSVAMPNRNPKVRDAPIDAPVEREAYMHLLEHKFVAALTAATMAHSAVVVVPDVGCGVYDNSPEDVGSALGKAIKTHFANQFIEIHLVGSEAFANAVKSV